VAHLQREGSCPARRFIRRALARVRRRPSSQKLAQADNTALPPAVLTASFAQVSFTSNPQQSQIRAEIQQAATAGLIEPVTHRAQIFNLTQLNFLLRSAGHKTVSS
jgi:hypothetical protein